MPGPTSQAVMATMVTSTKTVTKKGTGPGGRFPGPNGNKSGGNGWHGRDRSKRKFSPATYRITMLVILAAIVMMFAALSSAYIVLSSAENRQHVRMPPMFLLSTAIIIISSATLERAKRSLNWFESSRYTRWLTITLALGLVFLVSQLLGWRELARSGVYFSGHPDSTFFYLFTGVHGVHLIGGISLLLYLVFKSSSLLRGNDSEKARTGVTVVAWYWHTMDVLWLWLFGLLLVFE
jgi:cytochrome c oxidase subunit III